MIRLYLLLIFFLFSSANIAQESPKNIISNEKKTLFIEDNIEIQEKSETEEESEKLLELNDTETLKEYNVENLNNKNSIVIEDMPNNFNPWYGILSSDKKGLGWMMWGNTTFTLSKTLINKVNSSTDSPTLRLLLKNILLSRAKSPIINSRASDEVDGTDIDHKNKFPYLEEKIFHLVNAGFSEDIENLIRSIPQQYKNREFEEKVFYYRLTSFDVPFICNNVSKMLTTQENLIFYRKILVVCKLILKKEEEGMLALNLLENDLEAEDMFVNNVINYLEDVKNNSEEKSIASVGDSILFKILSLYDYASASRNFKSTPILFNKTIYDMKLFNKELQIEALEFLVNKGIYGHSLLIEEYNSLISEEEIIFYNKNQNNLENSFKLRAATFQIIINTISPADRAKSLMRLWKLAEDKNILKAISLITKSATMSLSPEPKLNWFNLPATKALILSDEIQAAKKWIFFGTSDIKERASIDIDFCRLLMLIYLHDDDILFRSRQQIELTFLLNILKNDLNLNEKQYIKFLLTLKALGENIQGEVGEIFFRNETFSQDKFKFIRDNAISYLILENATNNSNKAEKALHSISLLQDEIGLYKDMYSFYMGLKGLSLIGLESYSRRIAVEENFDFLSK